MTTVTYEPEEFHMRIEGHAGAGARGGDLVCAAVSTLGWTLIAAAGAVPEYGMQLGLHEKAARMDVRCHPAEEDEALCRGVFDTVASGFALLAERYPEYVSVTG